MSIIFENISYLCSYETGVEDRVMQYKFSLSALYKKSIGHGALGLYDSELLSIA